MEVRQQKAIAEKSALLQNVEETDPLRTAGGLVVSVVQQDTSFLSGSLTAYARAEGLEDSLYKALLRKLGFERVQFEKDRTDYSAGQKKKVLTARSLCQRAHLYIWDEPLNFADVFSRMQIEEAILQSRPTLLFSEHDEAFQSGIATRELSLPG